MERWHFRFVFIFIEMKALKRDNYTNKKFCFCRFFYCLFCYFMMLHLLEFLRSLSHTQHLTYVCVQEKLQNVCSSPIKEIYFYYSDNDDVTSSCLIDCQSSTQFSSQHLISLFSIVNPIQKNLIHGSGHINLFFCWQIDLAYVVNGCTKFSSIATDKALKFTHNMEQITNQKIRTTQNNSKDSFQLCGSTWFPFRNNFVCHFGRIQMTFMRQCWLKKEYRNESKKQMAIFTKSSDILSLNHCDYPIS